MAITFPSFKKHNGKAKMLSLLNEIQAFLLMGSEGEPLSMYQTALIPKTKTFIQFEEELFLVALMVGQDFSITPKVCSLKRRVDKAEKSTKLPISFEIRILTWMQKHSVSALY
jgi:hypothetical protein